MMKIGDCLSVLCNSGEWKLILTTNFIFAGKNYYGPIIDEEHLATAHGGVKKTMQYLTNRYKSQCLSGLVQLFVPSCDTC